MRIVSGSRKSIPLKAVPGDATRPTTDKVKESLFNILGPYFEGEFVLDLFAGSGSLGLEALSRGANYAVFVEKNGKAVKVLQENVEKARFTEQAEIMKGDARRILEDLQVRGVAFDLIFLDPPYAQIKLYSLAETILEMGLLKEDGLIICEHAKEVNVEDFIPSASCYRKEQYGSLSISFFEHKRSSTQ